MVLFKIIYNLIFIHNLFVLLIWLSFSTWWFLWYQAFDLSLTDLTPHHSQQCDVKNIWTADTGPHTDTGPYQELIHAGLTLLQVDAFDGHLLLSRLAVRCLDDCSGSTPWEQHNVWNPLTVGAFTAWQLN